MEAPNLGNLRWLLVFIDFDIIAVDRSLTSRWRLDPKTWTENEQYIYEHQFSGKKKFFLPFGTPGFAFKLGLLTRKKEKNWFLGS